MTPTLPEHKRTRWIEITVGLVSICAAVIVWQMLERHERHHIRRMVNVAAGTIQADLLADLQAQARDQAYLAEHAEFPGTSSANWKAHAARYMDLNPWCSAILWLDPEQKVGWVVPPSPQPALWQETILREAHKILAQSLTTRQPRITHSFHLPGGETAALTALPAFRAGKHVGFLLIVADLRKSVENMLADTTQMGYNVAVRDGDQEIFRREDSSGMEQKWGQDAEAQLVGVTWRLRVWPRAEVLAEAQSVVPTILFAVVSALGLALVLAVHYECVARNKSDAADRVNAQLTNEIAERQRIEAALRESQRRLAGVLQTSADGIISADRTFRITFFNHSAEQIFGYSAAEVLGKSLDTLLPPRFREHHSRHMQSFAAGAQDTMLMGERTGVFGLRKDGTEFPADAAISKLESDDEVILTAFLRDVTARVAAEEALRKAHEELEHRVAERTTELAAANASLHQLSGYLLRSQEDERRRIARELHDSTAGNLVLIGMALDKMRASSDPETAAAQHLEECWRWVQQTMADIRTLAYRLHPPMLEGLGLGSALRWYINGFRERSGINIVLEFDPNTPRLPKDMELTLFRIVQESLTNIHRHSQSDAAVISVTCEDSRVSLEIADRGIGIPAELLTDGTAMLGVGIAGMRERVQQMGGHLEIRSTAQGTTIVATLPFHEKSSPAMA